MPQYVGIGGGGGRKVLSPEGDKLGVACRDFLEVAAKFDSK